MEPRIHPRFPWYEVHPDGRVFRIKLAPLVGKGNAGKLGEIKGRVLKKSGYRQFKLCMADGRQAAVRANRLVAETFLGPAPSAYHQAAHNDGVRLNNAVGNIRWATEKENTSDKNLHGTMLRGEAIGNAKLTSAQVIEIRAKFTGKRGEIRRLAKEYGVGTSCMCRLVHGEVYTEVGPISPKRKKQIHLTPAQRAALLSAYVSQGFRAAKLLADAFGLDDRRIAAIAREHGFKHNYHRSRGVATPNEVRA